MRRKQCSEYFHKDTREKKNDITLFVDKINGFYVHKYGVSKLNNKHMNPHTCICVVN